MATQLMKVAQTILQFVKLIFTAQKSQIWKYENIKCLLCAITEFNMPGFDAQSEWEGKDQF